MQTVLWVPAGANDSILTAVWVKPGPVTQAQWLQALADRVQSLVDQEPDPQAALAWAVSTLNKEGAVTLPDSPTKAAGQTLVLHNLALETEMLRLMQDFPQEATANENEPEIMSSLENWVEAAAMALHPS